jgi:hypothetical protein
MNDNVPPRRRARYRPGFLPRRAALASPNARVGEDPTVQDPWGGLPIPVAARELDVIETFFGSLLDELLAHRLAA